MIPVGHFHQSGCDNQSVTCHVQCSETRTWTSVLKLYPTWAIVDMMQCQGMYAGDYPMSDYRDHPVSWYGTQNGNGSSVWASSPPSGLPRSVWGTSSYSRGGVRSPQPVGPRSLSILGSSQGRGNVWAPVCTASRTSDKR